MHRPLPDYFQSFHYPEEPFRASPVEGHWHPHHCSAPEHSKTGLLERVIAPVRHASMVSKVSVLVETASAVLASSGRRDTRISLLVIAFPEKKGRSDAGPLLEGCLRYELLGEIQVVVSVRVVLDPEYS